MRAFQHRCVWFQTRNLCDPAVMREYCSWCLVSIQVDKMGLKRRIHGNRDFQCLRLIRLPCPNSLSRSETTWTARGTTCWAWRGLLRTCWPRSPTSSSPTWRAEAWNRSPSRRSTRPASSPRPTLSESPPDPEHKRLHEEVGQGLGCFSWGPLSSPRATVDPDDETPFRFWEVKPAWGEPADGGSFTLWQRLRMRAAGAAVGGKF